ncbi:MAG: hypothetical protein OES99_11350, partial [Gammaproteobacteria bacterium]|nr:hypothetical protein [Gammaproteobacteria bacterium]
MNHAWRRFPDESRMASIPGWITRGVEPRSRYRFGVSGEELSRRQNETGFSLAASLILITAGSATIRLRWKRSLSPEGDRSL